MIKFQTKKPVIIGIIIGAAAVAIAVAAVLLWPRKPDPRKLLQKADSLSEQNLCLTALLEQEAANEELWRQLLANYRILGADPLTLEATAQAAEQAVGHAIETAEEVTAQREEPGSILGTGGIIQGGIKLTDHAGANALATDGETVYLAKDTGIYAYYRGLEVQLTAARAERMIAAENGLYYLNATARRVQYIARDGHRSETLSELPAEDFAFLDGVLWIAGSDGVLYRDGTPVETPLAPKELCVAGGVLYAAADGGLMQIGTAPETVLPSPVRAIAGGTDGCVYYLDQNGYPAKFDPAAPEATILKEKTALAIGFSEGKAWYLNENGKLKMGN